MTQDADWRVRPTLRRRLTIGALCAAGWLLVGIQLGISRPWTRNPPCQLKGEEEVQVSPDGKLAVQLVHETCDHGWIFLEVLSRLDAWRIVAPQQRYTLAGWARSSNNDAVSVAWTGAAAVRLELTARSGARLDPAPMAGLVLTLVQAAPTRDGGR